MPGKKPISDENSESGHSLSGEKEQGFLYAAAMQLKRYFKRLSPEIEMQTYTRGRNQRYDVNIHLTLRGKGLFAEQTDVWVTCLWNDKNLIGKQEIQKLIEAAQDAFSYIQALGGFSYDSLAVVANRDYDTDALDFATQNDVLCLCFDKGQIKEKNYPTNWARFSAWMKQASY